MYYIILRLNQYSFINSDILTRIIIFLIKDTNTILAIL